MNLAKILLAFYASAAVSTAKADNVTWSQTGASTATATSAPDDNVNWLVAANWSGSAGPGSGDAIFFNDVTADQSAIAGVNGRYVVFRNSDFLGTSANSLTLTQTSSFANTVEIRQDGGEAANGNDRFGEVTISSKASLLFTGQQTTTSTDAVWSRQLTLGSGGTAVSNAGTLTTNFAGNGNNRSVAGYLSVSDGGTFANTGTFTFNAGASNSAVQGGTWVNALFGATTNTASIVINRSGDNTGGANTDEARGGIEFATFTNSGAGSSLTFTINNATLLSIGVASPVISDRAANLVVAGAWQNNGTFTINRTPLASGSGASGSSTDATSRVTTVQVGTFNNCATGAFVVNHSNSATSLSTTASTVDMTSLGTAINSGWISLKGSATITTGSDGAILTRLNTKGGFSNAEGGIITINGLAILANTGAFSNANTQTSRAIQGASRSWNTMGLSVVSTTESDAVFGWATGVVIDPAALSLASFAAENFTLGNLSLTTGSAKYTLGGGGDLLINGSFLLTGHLDLGDWTLVSSEAGKGQSLLFNGLSQRAYVDSLIAGGNIMANLASGYSLGTFASSANDSFYIGVAVPEPSPSGLCLVVAACGIFPLRQRLQGLIRGRA